MSASLELNSWTQFKQICITTKNLNCQFTESDRLYDLYGPDADGLIWHTNILKTDPAGSDQTDFETNYKTIAFNFAIGERSYAAASADFIADDDSFSGTFSKSPDGTPTTTEVYYQFTHVVYVSGGEFWTIGSGTGDKVIVDLVDKDGVVVIPASMGGNGAATFPAKTVISAYIRSRLLCPVDNFVRTFSRPYWAKPPVGIYLRIRGVIVNQTSDVTFSCNLFLHKPI